MIILDLETSGLDPQIHGMLSLGAVDFETGDEFYGECRLGANQRYSLEALKINGFDGENIYDSTKQTQVELYQKFVKWASGRSTLVGGHNVGSFDVQFLKKVHSKQKKITKFPFQFRYVDLHSVAYQRFGESLSMSQICGNLGINPEPTPHNALTGAKKEYECFKILLDK